MPTTTTCSCTISAIGLIAVAVAMGVAEPVEAANGSECAALLSRADVYANGKLSSAYATALVSTGRAVLADGSVDRVTIVNGCNAGAFDALMAKSAGPSAASHSYTEAQARERFESSGLGSVAGLREDKQGIWWATAMQSGKCVTGALDNTGNILVK